MGDVAENEVYVLQNNRGLDEYQSAKMKMIVERHPETSYQEKSFPYTWNESGMAQLFAEIYNKDTRYCPEAKCWYTYYEGAWRKDVGSHLVSAKIVEFYQLMVLYCG